MRIGFVAIALFAVQSLGCGDGHAKKAGQAVGETITDFAKGVGSGIDKRLEVDVELSPKAVASGLSKTVAKSAGIDGQEKGITVYLLSRKPVSGSLIAKALNHEGAEIGRSVVDVDFAADDAEYVTFHFDKEIDSQLVERYLVDIKPAAAAPN